MHGLWRGDGSIGVAHGGHGNEAAFQDDSRFDTKEGRLPNDQVGPFTHFNAAHFMANAVRDGGVDGKLGNVAFHTGVVVALGVARQLAALHFHFVRSLPATQNHFTHAAHGLAVRAEHADGTEVMQDVFGCDGFFANTAFGKGQVFGNGGV